MRETLIYLSHLDHEDTEKQVAFSYLSFCTCYINFLCDFSYPNVLFVCLFIQMLRKLNKQLNGEDWTWNNLNTLCWAIGSISGSMMEEQVCACVFFLFWFLTNEHR